MKLVRLGLPDENNIVTRNKFIVNRILPVAIRSTSVQNQYIILFTAYQDYDESFVYFQLMVKSDNSFDTDFLECHTLNIKQFSEDKLCNSNIKKEKLDAYKQMISQMNNSNVFATDLDMVEDEEHPFYYKAIGVKAIDKSHASVLDIFFPVDNFVKVRLYLDKIINFPFKNHIYEEVFRDNKYHNIEIVNIETVKLDATAKIISQNNAFIEYKSHYTMHCGPSKFIMNWSSVLPFEELLINPLDAGLYNSFYGEHYRVNELFTDEEYLYLIYEDRYVDGSFKKLFCLRLNKELASKTNFIDQDYIFNIKR